MIDNSKNVAAYRKSLAAMEPKAVEYFVQLASDLNTSHVKIAKLMNKAGYVTGRGGAFDWRNVSQIALHFGYRRKTGGPKKSYTRTTNKITKSQQIELNYTQETKNERRALIDLIMEAKTISKTERAKAIEALME